MTTTSTSAASATLSTSTATEAATTPQAFGRKPRICLIAPGLLPVPASQGGAIETLMTSLIEENERYGELDLTVVTTFDTESRILARNIRKTRFIWIPTAGLVERAAFKIRHAIIRRARRNYALTPTPYYQRVLRTLARRDDDFDAIILEGGPSNPPIAFVKRFGNQLWYHLHYVPETDFTSGYSTVLAVSDYAAQAWLTHCQNNTARVVTVRNGIDIERFQRHLTDTERNELRASLGLSPNDFVVMYCGRIIPVKGVLELLQAMESINNPHIKLLMVGSPNFGKQSSTDYLQTVEEHVHRLAERVAFTGYIPNDQLWKYGSIADLQAVPSLWEDAAPTVCMEAMAMGLPLLVTRSGGIQEYTTDKCAITVPKDGSIVQSLESAIRQLADDSDRLCTISHHERTHVQEYAKRPFYSRFVEACRRA